MKSLHKKHAYESPTNNPSDSFIARVKQPLSPRTTAEGTDSETGDYESPNEDEAAGGVYEDIDLMIKVNGSKCLPISLTVL